MVDILFINPGDHKKTYQALSSEFSAIAPPVWTLLLSNFTRKQGFSTAIYDVNVEGWSEMAAAEVLSRYNPSLIVMMVYGHQPSASTQTMPSASKIAVDIKRANNSIPLAMGGLHPSALSERTLREEKVDYVLKGEGAYPIIGLINCIHGKLSLDEVPGLWRRKGAECVFSEPVAAVENLDDVFDDYAWDLLPGVGLNNYRAHNFHCFDNFKNSRNPDFSDVRSPYAVIYTSLGCPYTCHYCCINSIFGKSRTRNWSLEKVAGWIDTLVTQYFVKTIRLDDELFVLSPKRVERFCDMMIERNYGLNIYVYGRVDTIRRALVTKMKRAGINWVCLGIEAGDKQVREGVNKKINKDIKEVVQILQAADIHVQGNYMFGLPDDNLETMRSTLNLAMELNCEHVNFYCVMAYPGSKLYEEYTAQPSILPAKWDGFSQHGYATQPLPTKYLPARDVLTFRDNAFYAYFSNPVYLEMMQAKFGEKVVWHLKRMLEIKLQRQLLEKDFA